MFREIVNNLRGVIPIGGVVGGIVIPDYGYTLAAVNGDVSYVEEAHGSYKLVFVRHMNGRISEYKFELGGFASLGDLNTVLTTILNEF